MVRATTPKALVVSYSALKSGVVSPSTLSARLHRAFRSVSRGSKSKFLHVLVHTFAWSSQLNPLPLFVGWI